MLQFSANFERLRHGVWRCIAPATLTLAQGCIDVAPETVFVLGTTILGVEIAQLLEEQYDRTKQSSELCP